MPNPTPSPTPEPEPVGPASVTVDAPIRTGPGPDSISSSRCRWAAPSSRRVTSPTATSRCSTRRLPVGWPSKSSGRRARSSQRRLPRRRPRRSRQRRSRRSPVATEPVPAEPVAVKTPRPGSGVAFTTVDMSLRDRSQRQRGANNRRSGRIPRRPDRGHGGWIPARDLQGGDRLDRRRVPGDTRRPGAGNRQNTEMRSTPAGRSCASSTPPPTATINRGPTCCGWLNASRIWIPMPSIPRVLRTLPVHPLDLEIDPVRQQGHLRP